MSSREFHRYGEEYINHQEWHNAPDTRRRVALALGPDPVSDARHLLPPLPLPPPSPPLPDGPHPSTEFVVDLTGSFPIESDAVRNAFSLENRGSLGLASLWALPIVGSRQQPRWVHVDDIQTNTRLSGLALSWELASLLTEGTEAIAELAAYTLRADERARLLQLQAVAREEPNEAATRARRLNDLRLRFSRPVEMRLMPQGRFFPARSVWRAAYALGLIWGDLDLFYWHDSVSGRRLFRLNALGHPGYFLPERAAEGEGKQGIALSFELPHNPAPLQTYDRMGVALSYFRQQLGGRPLTADGAELDADRLWTDRDSLAEAIQEMSRAGIAPGSPEATRLF